MERLQDVEDSIQIIVADDEMIGADDLSDLIQEKYGESYHVVVRTAYNAKSVLKMVDEQPCDILITDIQMPGMSGLMLAQEIRRKFEETSILFLTGYDDFSYAYEAFKYDAERYLLKTEGDEEIVRAVEIAIRRVQERRQVLSKIHDAEKRYAQMLPVYRRQVVLQLLTDGVEESTPEDAQIQEGRLYVVAARIGASGSRVRMRLKLIALNAIAQIVENALDGALMWSTGYVIDGELVWVFSMNSDAPFASTLFNLMRLARKHVEEQLKLPLFFVVANRETNYRMLSETYYEIRSVLTGQILQDSTGVAIYSQEQLDNPYTEAQLEEMNTLRRCLYLCQKDIRNSQLEDLAGHAAPLLEYLRNHASGTDLFYEELSSAFTGILLNYLNRNGLSYIAVECGKYRAQGEASFFENLIQRMNEQSNTRRDNAVKSIAEYVDHYIRDHLSEDISAGVLAEVTGYSSGYLSRVFRQEFNESIHEYVTATRMNLAKELLGKTNLRVYEIANHCGFDNPTYFIKVFKKTTGMTPQDYKQSLRR